MAKNGVSWDMAPRQFLYLEAARASGTFQKGWIIAGARVSGGSFGCFFWLIHAFQYKTGA